MEKVGRNDPCPCGSGKKFKKCCESKTISKRFTAHKIESAQQVNLMTDLFKSRISKQPPAEQSPSSEKTE